MTSILHASCVALSGRGVLILGASGTGKSALALDLMARGAALVADDRTCLTSRDGGLIASAPAPIRGMIEARGVGLLAAETCGAAPVVLAIDMNRIEDERLPPRRDTTILGCRLDLLHKVEHTHFPAAIVQYLKGGRCA
ncbi:HPr kinase/phosphorylase [Actibacterium sp. D379-3]